VEVIKFEFEGFDIQAVQRDGEPWFVTGCVCEALGLSNVTEAVRGLEPEELSSVLMKSGGQRRKIGIVSESGLYALIFKSRKDAAKRFRRWVTKDVIPSIRKTGQYSLPRRPMTRIERLEKELELERAKEARYDLIAPQSEFGDLNKKGEPKHVLVSAYYRAGDRVSKALKLLELADQIEQLEMQFEEEAGKIVPFREAA
jgi:prophage antirepressor-like protein